MIKGLQGEVTYDYISNCKSNGKRNTESINHGMMLSQYDKYGNLCYYKNTFLCVSKMDITTYWQRYAFNQIANIVDYCDSDGVKWSKQYTKEGYEVYYRDKNKKKGYIFDYKHHRITSITERGTHILINTDMIDNVSLLDGVDTCDRFLSNNKKLIEFFVSGLSLEELYEKWEAFKRPYIPFIYMHSDAMKGETANDKK